MIFNKEQIISLLEANTIIYKLYETNPETFNLLPKFNLKKIIEENKENNLKKFNNLMESLSNK